MNNLQPLVWHEQQGWFSTKSPLTEYQVALCGERYRVLYTKRSDGFAREATGFATVEDAKEWAWNHYNEKMQPHVKPSPTWISVGDKLPERKELLSDKDKCLVLTECGKVWTGFYNMHIKPDDWYLHGWTEKQGWHPFKIVAWMLASELSTMQNLHNASEVMK